MEQSRGLCSQDYCCVAFQEEKGLRDGATYIVQRGDTLAGVALRLGLKQSDLKRANHMYGSKSLITGQVRTGLNKIYASLLFADIPSCTRLLHPALFLFVRPTITSTCITPSVLQEARVNLLFVILLRVVFLVAGVSRGSRSSTIYSLPFYQVLSLYNSKAQGLGC